MWLFLRRLRARLTHRHFDRDLQDELATHREMAERALIQRGASTNEARAAAARVLGNMGLAREDARRVWIAGWVETVWQDAHDGLRMLRRNPLFACMAVGALVLGVSLNISLFTVFNAFVLRAWPVGHADRVVVIERRESDQTMGGMPAPEIRFLNANAKSIEVVAYGEERVQIGADATAQEAPVRIVSANFFSALEIPLQLGRGFAPSDDGPLNARPVLVLSGPAWRNRFGGDPAIIGRSVNLNNVPFIAIGVAVDGAGDSPATVPPDGWLPIVALSLLEPNEPFAKGLPIDPHRCCVNVAGRLRDGVTAEAAAAELKALDQQFSVTSGLKPAVDVRLSSTRLIDQPQQSRLVPMLARIFIGTLLLLLLACANVGNLLLARALARQREIGVRLALGAGRARIIRQLLTEGLVLAGVAMVVALPIARLLPSLIFRFIDSGSATNPNPVDFGLDPAVLLFATVVAVASSLLFSLAPALRGTRAVAASVRAARTSATSSRLPLRTALLALQVAISAVLLVVAGLLSRGITHAAAADLGFRTDGVVAAAINLPKNAYSDSARNALGDQLASELQTAGVGTIGFGDVQPLGSRGMMMTTLPIGFDKQAGTVRAGFQAVSPGYFDVLRIPTVKGRIFSEHEPHAVVINRTLERMLFRGESAIGKSLQIAISASGGVTSPTATPEIVVGVVKDAQISGLGVVPPTFFRPAQGFSDVVIAADTPEVIARIRSAVKVLEPRAVVITTRILDNVTTQLRVSRLGAMVAAGIGLCAVLLAGVGVFGVFSYMVTERGQEIGLRLALGARGSDIVRTVLGGVAVSIGSGLGVGLLLAAAAGSLLSNSLYGLSPRDPLAFAWAVGVLAMAGLGSTALPIWRALRIDPASTLRQD